MDVDPDMDDSKAAKDAVRLLGSLASDAAANSHEKTVALIVGYLRSYYEAGYACAVDHAREGKF